MVSEMHKIKDFIIEQCKTFARYDKSDYDKLTKEEILYFIRESDDLEFYIVLGEV